MEKIPTQDILRFFVAGSVALVFAYICSPDEIAHLIAMAGPIGTPGMVFSVGAVLFMAYRPFIYPRWIRPDILMHVGAESLSHRVGEGRNLGVERAEVIEL